MSRPQPPSPGKLVIGMFMKDKALLPPVAKALEDAFGPVDLVSPWLPFDYTRYYQPEMGAPLFRRIFAFKDLMAQEDLPVIKLRTNSLEDEHTDGDRRGINIDPGYLLLEKFVLATGKNFSHRIYIGRGIYADLTLTYARGAFQTLPWTYPDYASAEIRQFLLQVRHKYSMDLKKRESEVRSQKSE
jgi:hypothetical protein